MEASAEKAQHNKATQTDDFESRVAEADDFESRVAEAVESRLAEAVELRLAEVVEKNIQAMREKTESLRQSMKREALEKRKASRQIKVMEGMDYVDRGDYYEVVIKGPFINTEGRLGLVLKESFLKEDYILFSGVPPITVKYPKNPRGRSGLSSFKAMQDLRYNIISQVSQTIREAPKEIHAAYRQAYYRAIEEYDERVKNKPPSDQDEEIEKIRDEHLRLARIKADKIIRDEQIRADQIRAAVRKAKTKNVGNQSGQVDPQKVNVDLAPMINVKGTFKESDIENHISKRQAIAQLMTEKYIAAAHIKADKIIENNKALLALRREVYEKRHRGDPGEARKFDETMFGFKVSDETQLVLKG